MMRQCLAQFFLILPLEREGKCRTKGISLLYIGHFQNKEFHIIEKNYLDITIVRMKNPSENQKRLFVSTVSFMYIPFYCMFQGRMCFKKAIAISFFCLIFSSVLKVTNIHSDFEIQFNSIEYKI